MTLYADVLFAINFSMDFVSLFICAMIQHKRIEKKRILLASVLGGAYGVIDIILETNAIIGALISVFVSLLMCLIAFYEKKLKRLILSYIMFWATSTALGGIMSLLYTFANKLLADIIASYSYQSAYNGARFFIIASISIIIGIIFSRIFTSKKDVKSTEIKITYQNKEYKLSALCDSGNLLTEPISAKCVILVTSNSDIGSKITALEDIYKRYIPYSDVGGNGALKGIIPEKIIVGDNMVDAIIAPINKNDFGGFDALVPSALV